MGEWDDACVICGGPPSYGHSAPEHETEWLDSCLGITEASTEPVQLGPYNGSGSYGDDGDFVSHAVWSAFHPEKFGVPRNPYQDYQPWYRQAGIVCHKACWELLYKELGYKIKYSDVWPLQRFGSNLLEGPYSYGGMTTYYDQFFFVDSCLHNTPWMLQDPCTCTRNAKRILQIWQPIVKRFKEAGMSNAGGIITSSQLCCLDSFATGSCSQVGFAPACACPGAI